MPGLTRNPLPNVTFKTLDFAGNRCPRVFAAGGCEQNTESYTHADSSQKPDQMKHLPVLAPTNHPACPLQTISDVFVPPRRTVGQVVKLIFDFYTAVTFLLISLGAGALAAMVLAPPGREK